MAKISYQRDASVMKKYSFKPLRHTTSCHIAITNTAAHAILPPLLASMALNNAACLPTAPPHAGDLGVCWLWRVTLPPHPAPSSPATRHLHHAAATPKLATFVSLTNIDERIMNDTGQHGRFIARRAPYARAAHRGLPLPALHRASKLQHRRVPP